MTREDFEFELLTHDFWTQAVTRAQKGLPPGPMPDEDFSQLARDLRSGKRALPPGLKRVAPEVALGGRDGSGARHPNHDQRGHQGPPGGP